MPLVKVTPKHEFATLFWPKRTSGLSAAASAKAKFNADIKDMRNVFGRPSRHVGNTETKVSRWKELAAEQIEGNNETMLQADSLVNIGANWKGG